MRRLSAFLVAAFGALVLSTAAAPAAKIGVTYSNPAWSPDGTRIAWSSDQFIPGSKPIHEALPPGQIWMANADGSEAAPLVSGLINGTAQIAWPKRQEILYDSYSVISLVRPNGRHKRILHSVGTTFSTVAKGTRVASASDFGGPIEVARTGSGKRIRIGGGKGMLNFDPALSPDGRRIVFNREPANAQQVGQNGLFIARANGKAMHRLTAHGSCANWSPRGDEIAFWTDTRGIVLRVVRPNGSHERVLVKGGGTSCGVPQLMAWSPDGRQIAVVRGGRIVIVNVASGHHKKLWAFTWVDGLAWSPDSKQLLVTASPRQDGCYSLWTINVDGKNKKLIRSCKSR